MADEERLTTGIVSAEVLMHIATMGMNFLPLLYSECPAATFIIPHFTEIEVYARCGTDVLLSAVESQMRLDQRLVDVALSPDDLVLAAMELIKRAEHLDNPQGSYSPNILSCQAAFLILDDDFDLRHEGACIVVADTPPLVPPVIARIFPCYGP